jgi:hypothetical protein
LGKGEKGRGVWAKQPSSTSPPSRYRIEARWTGGRPVEGGRGAGDPGHGDDREVGQNEEDLEGNRFRSLPWAGVLWRGRSMAGSGAARGGGRGGTGGGNGGLGKEGKLVMEVRGEVGSRSGPFIGAGRSVRREYLSSRSLDGRQWLWGEISRRRPWAGKLPCGAALWM